MNLFIRMFWVIFWAGKKPQAALSDKDQQSFRVWPHDLGWRDHLPNYRVFSFMELGRFAVWNRSRLTKTKAYGFRMIAAQDFVYLKPIMPLQKFDMTTELLSYDEKYFYFRHNFLVKGKLMGIGLVKEASVKKGKVVKPADILAEANQTPELSARSSEHSIVASWLTTHKVIKDY